MSTISETLKEDLKSLRCEGNIAHLPSEQLNDYAGLKKVLTKATGKYTRNTFVFPVEAQAVVDKLIGGQSINFKKEFQFFATPPELAEYMCNQIVGNFAPKVLEPSAGHGALIEAILKARPEAEVEAVELSDINFRVLSEKWSETIDNVSVCQGDFLTMDFGSEKYDIVIANPPFSKNQDIDHIMKMYDLVKKGGQLITIASKSWTFGSQKKQEEFASFVDDQASLCIELDQGAFKTSGTNVSAMLLVFNR
jgi:phospholipid N-methyltransferase